jgi:hypothetical protein
VKGRRVHRLLAAVLLSCTGAATAEVRPFVHCIEILGTPATVRVVFGYESNEASIAQIPAGPTNALDPAPPGVAPLTVFRPGLVLKAFRVVYAPSATQPALAWQLEGVVARASWDSPRCGPVRADDIDPWFRFEDGFE